MAIIVSFVASILMAQGVKPRKVEAIDLGKGIKLEMVFIPAGKFKMGSPETEKGRQQNEVQHDVVITKIETTRLTMKAFKNIFFIIDNSIKAKT